MSNTVTAKEIQQEMVTAQDEILAKSTALRNVKDAKQKHCAGLRELGFTQSANVLEQQVQEAEGLFHLTDRYSFEYPGLKFIAYDTMDTVCGKYGLALGEVSRYTGEVPEWALAQIKANKRHIEFREEFNEDLYYNRMYREASTRHTEGQKGVLYFYTKEGGYAYGGDHVTSAGHDWKEGGEVFDKKHGMEVKSNLMIAAPIADMDIRSNERVQNGQIVEVHSLDPIVCVNVDGGYIVLAAWGEEGSDPEVFNVTNN